MPSKKTTIGRKTIQLRVSPTEYDAFCERAKELDLTVSEWLRMLARHDSGLWMGGIEWGGQSDS